VNKTLPYLVSNVVELLELEEMQEEEGANVDLDAHKTKCAVIKTSTRATYFLPVVGLVDPSELKPADLVGVNKDSYLVLEKLPAEYDSRVKAMEVKLHNFIIFNTIRKNTDLTFVIFDSVLNETID
jgi:26S proteasome regulatory subunit T5